LSTNLLQNQHDPQCRHIFIQSNHSTAWLNCSASMLKLLFTFHQVDPSFLEFVYTFGSHDEPVDAFLSYFQNEDDLYSSQLSPIVTLNRSGREIRHSFLLRGIEIGPQHPSTTTDSWIVRQVGVYHAFDVINGRTVWITLKGNSRLQKVIREDSPSLPDGSLGASFEASLATHLIYFHWCTHSWRWFVRDIEGRIKKALFVAKELGQREISDDKIQTLHTGDMSVSFAGMKSRSSWQKLRERLQTTDENCQRTLDSDGNQPGESTDFWHGFKQKGLLAITHGPLTNLISRLEEVILVVQLDISTLEDVCEKYEKLVDRGDVGEELRATMKNSVAVFVGKVRQMIRGLEVRHKQLHSLQASVKEGKALFESMMQFRTFQASHRSAITMEKETVSMHVVTVVTMLFLPATFISTFFQSGIIQLRETEGFEGQWMLHMEAFALYIQICIPLTAVTMFVWFLVNYRAKLKSIRTLSEAQVNGTVDKRETSV
ncbi:hypothetical protein QBC41DRAFT_224283, partial [Cercophora samala]